MKAQFSKILPLPPKAVEQNSFPFVDQFIFMDIGSDNLLSRGKSLKHDPTTGIVYDPVVNPVPEADKKLIARLEHVEINEENIVDECNLWNKSIEEMIPFFDRFGYEEINIPVMQIIEGESPLSETMQKVVTNIKQILEIKYEWYAADQVPHHYRILIPDELGSDHQPDLSDKNDSQKLDPTSFLHPHNQSPPHRIPSMRDGMHSSNLLHQGESQKKLVKKPSYYSASKGSYKKLETMSQRSGMTRKEKLLMQCVDSWEKIFVDYTENLERNLKEVKNIFHILEVHFDTSQKVFAKIFKEKREFHAPLISFVDGYRRLAADNPEVIKGEYCKQKMYEKIDSVHDLLWAEVEKCREKAIAEKEKLITKNLVTSDIHSLCRIMLSLVAGEMNKLFHLR